MEFEFSQEQQGFREELCQFLRDELTPEVRREHSDPSESLGYSWGFVRGFRRRMAQRGYIGVGWPKEAGGGGKDMVYQVLFQEEMEYHEAPMLAATDIQIPQAILLFGTEEQKRFFLPRIRAGEAVFFLGYSEPEAGSDLASLQCRAVLEGDEFVVNGQKLFSSQANHADYGWMAVRTDPNSPKHRGISLMIVDMRSPGISLQSFTTMGGWKHPAVAFDDVRVPRNMLVGEINRGWYQLMTAIDVERVNNGSPGHVTRLFDNLLAYCRETRRGAQRLIDMPTVRATLADLAADVQSTRLVAYWAASMYAQGLLPQHETSLVSLVMRETARKVSAAHLELLGPYAQLQRGSKWAPQEGEAEFHYRNDMFFSFAAGGFDITRTVIARRGLGLPRD